MMGYLAISSSVSGFALSGVALAIAIMALLAFCKVPVIGPVLYTAIFPISIVGFAVLFYAFVFVGIFALPAIWNGYSVMETLRRLLGIIRTLTDAGNTVVVVEHDMRVVAGCDWVCSA